MNKINFQELKAFREALPKDIQDEHFSFLNICYSVVRALYLIEKEKLETKIINVQDWSKSIGADYEYDEQAINILNGVCDKDALKDNINTSIPIIFVEHSYKIKNKTKTCDLLIDGNKRLRKAFLKKELQIKAYYLPKKLAKLCLV